MHLSCPITSSLSISKLKTNCPTATFGVKKMLIMTKPFVSFRASKLATFKNKFLVYVINVNLSMYVNMVLSCWVNRFDFTFEIVIT
jgi:hypothetical protein